VKKEKTVVTRARGRLQRLSGKRGEYRGRSHATPSFRKEGKDETRRTAEAEAIPALKKVSAEKSGGKTPKAPPRGVLALRSSLSGEAQSRGQDVGKEKRGSSRSPAHRGKEAVLRERNPKRRKSPKGNITKKAAGKAN